MTQKKAGFALLFLFLAMTCEEIVASLQKMSNPEYAAGAEHFGIKTKMLGISVPQLQEFSKSIGQNHQLAQELWACGFHEARVVACYIEEPALVTEVQMEQWVSDFDNWAICDHCCSAVFRKTAFAYSKIRDWVLREEEFVRRAAFSLMAIMAVHDKKSNDQTFVELLTVAEKYADDDRNFVKKAINWAIRQIGKRTILLNEKAIETALRIKAGNSRSGRWIAADALRELQSEAVFKKLWEKAHPNQNLTAQV